MRRPLRFVIALSLTGLLSAAVCLAQAQGTGASPSALAQASAPPGDELVAFYHGELLRLQGTGIGRGGSLDELLAPLFAAAASRTREGDPLDENRALLDVLASWAAGRAGPGPSGGRPSDFRLTLAGRRDLARHFLISAALAARGETGLSHAVGLLKEITDAAIGSGFSFADIAADRAGVRFGEAAGSTQDGARALQKRVAAGIDDADLMPPVADLPERLDRAALSADFGGAGGKAYRALVAEIDRRIASLPLYAP